MKNTYITVISALFLVFTYAGQAANYYIDQNNPAASDQNKGTIDKPWKTITKANQSLLPGDTVFIKAGSYNTFIAPDHSGTAHSRITFKNYKTDKVIITEAPYGIFLNNKSYISISGIDFQNLDRFVYLQKSSDYNTISYCNFDQARMTNGKTASWAGSVINRDSKYNRIDHCRFSKYGYFNNDDISCVLDIGDENITTDFTSNNLIENCTFYHGGHHILGVYGMYNVIRNNYFHNEPWSMGTPDSDRGAILYGDRNINVSGYIENSGRNLFEGNQIAYSSDPSDNVGASGMSLTTSYNIVRFNRFYFNDLAGVTMSVTRSYCQDIVQNKIYNNTFLRNSINKAGSGCGIAFAVYSGEFFIKYNTIKNNIFYKHKRLIGTYRVNPEDQYFVRNWEAESLGDPKFVNADTIPGDPMNQNQPDFHLQAGSPCIDMGIYLTTITSAAGSGNTFTVADPGYFIDGWGIAGVQGDEIQLFHTNQKARITGVNYETGTITLDRKITWKQNQGVSLAYKNIAPDLGAYEYDDIRKN